MPLLQISWKCHKSGRTKPPGQGFKIMGQTISECVLYVPYARHYNPRFVFILPHFPLRFMFERGLYCREVSNYMNLFSSKVNTKIFAFATLLSLNFHPFSLCHPKFWPHSCLATLLSDFLRFFLKKFTYLFYFLLTK